MKKSNHKFKIQHIDPLGQGVSKYDEEVFFVRNTLEGEKGTAEVDGEKKGLYFGRLSDPKLLTEISEMRINPICPHFFNCNGCHFLHTSYENEIEIKKKNLIRNIQIYDRKTGHQTSPKNIFTHHPVPGPVHVIEFNYTMILVRGE